MISQCSSGGFGSPTDWLSAIAAIISAVGLFVVAAKTNRLADKANDLSQANVGLAASANDIATSANVIGKSANHIAESVVEIERSRDLESAQTRASEQRMLLLSLSGPIGHTAIELRSIVDDIEDYFARGIVSQSVELSTLTDRLVAAQYTVTDSVRSRIHFLDDAISARVLRTEGLFVMFRADYANDGGKSISEALELLLPSIRNMRSDVEFVDERCNEVVQAAGINR